MIPIKNEREIEAMRKACRVAAEVLDKLENLVTPGMATRDIDEACADFIAEAGAKSAFLGYRKFPGNLCVSVNEEVVHGIGGDRRLAYGDILKLDVGIVKDGWIGDNATTIRLGVVPPAVDGLVEHTARILHDVIPHVRPGKRVGDISAFIEQAALAHGYSVVREFVGHGVGRKLHEEPQIPNYGKPGRGPKLKPGMTLAIEPMINLGASAVRVLEDKWTVVTADGLPSAHFEHTVLVTKDQPEVLTWRKKTLLK
ncbi:MAG: type I methionyl aminopeptidase [Chthoniobacterales bacterium]|nr:type I methionyl aminopeptidase [Chthoniobacterales bacterium]